MKLSEVKNQLKTLTKLQFLLPDGTFVPEHFHVTEVGKVNKQFIDCGGTLRSENRIAFQLWEANDYDHRLHPDKLMNIIELSEKLLALEDDLVEVEYQGTTIGKYHLEFDGMNFLLANTTTDCLAPDKCGVPVQKVKLKMADIKDANSCTPGSGCC